MHGVRLDARNLLSSGYTSKLERLRVDTEFPSDAARTDQETENGATQGQDRKDKGIESREHSPSEPDQSDPSPSIPPVADLSNDQIERALLTGEDAGVLEDYFGPRDYAELRELAQRASTRRARGGPKVLILPGITGSRLGTRSGLGLPRTSSGSIRWRSPPVLSASWRLNSGVKIVPTGVILLFYLKLKLRLMARRL